MSCQDKLLTEKVRPLTIDFIRSKVTYFIVFTDDLDFIRLPKFLPCLHTVCSSCIEDERDRSKYSQVTCPLCKTKFVLHNGTVYLPIDVISLHDTVETTRHDLISKCYKCYQDTDSFAWCFDCNIALCEFHNEDHSLTIETTHHETKLMKDVSMNSEYQSKLQPKVPTLKCPEEINENATIYCFNCLHAISMKSMLSRHSAHKVANISDIYESTKATIRQSVDRSNVRINELKSKIGEIRFSLQELDKNQEKSLDLIQQSMETLKNMISLREKELSDKVVVISNQKRKFLLSQLNHVTILLEDTEHVRSIGHDIIQLAEENESCIPYLVNASDVINSRINDVIAFHHVVGNVVNSEDNSLRNSHCLPNLKLENSFIEASLHPNDVSVISGLLSTIGAIHDSPIKSEIVTAIHKGEKIRNEPSLAFVITSR